eukprot:CAMPEP_0177584414 /NCGR_PEP_ID=MMETSP0419_2-20121207/3881_1 /TAXON_ID=582737 /ORGANISM="Tetraselmis sp., Strain GSL018" /LENGTH=324 /DNA_ID=CAMNT_0019073947 /DNA_START=298 /DNA_END=1269 /DNA_ORIENTATION=-
MFETRRGRLIALGCTVGIGAVLAYRTGSYEKVRARLYRIARTLGIYHDIASHGGELVSDLLKDLQEFLHSDSKDVPRSFCQLARLLSSEEAVELYASLARGAVRGAGGSPPGGSGGSGGAALADRFLELLFSERGESLVSVAVAMAARSSAQALALDAASRDGGGSTAEELVAAGSGAVLRVIGDPEGRRAISAFIAAFVSSGVGTYFDKSNERNYYEDIVASVATPSNREAVEHISAHVCREAIGAFFTYAGSGAAEGGRQPLTPSPPAARKALTFEEAAPAEDAAAPAPPPRPPPTPAASIISQVFEAASTEGGRRVVADLA